MTDVWPVEEGVESDGVWQTKEKMVAERYSALMDRPLEMSEVVE